MKGVVMDGTDVLTRSGYNTRDILGNNRVAARQ